MAFVLDNEGRPLIVKDYPNANWSNDAIQFARLIAEAEAAGLFDSGDEFDDMLASMDLNVSDVREITERAQAVWDDVVART